jgi:hypothetical protein
MLGFGHGWRWTPGRIDTVNIDPDGFNASTLGLQRQDRDRGVCADNSRRPRESYAAAKSEHRGSPSSWATRSCPVSKGLWSRSHTRRTRKRSRGHLTTSEVVLVISLAGDRQRVDSEAAVRNLENTRPRTGPGHIMALMHLPETEKESYRVRGTASAEQHSGVNLNRNSMTRETDAISLCKCKHGWA